MATPFPDEVKIRIEIKNTAPIELIDLTESLLSFGQEYQRFVAMHPEVTLSTEVRLYIAEIKMGSLIAELVALGLPLLPHLDKAKQVIEYLKFLKGGYDYLIGRAKEKPLLEKVDYYNLGKFIEPVAKDHGSQLNVYNTGPGTVNVINISLNSTEANAAQNVVNRDLAKLKEPDSRLHPQAVMYWHQARNDPKAQVGDRAVIESIQKPPVKVIFASEEMKAQLLYSPEPFKSAYIVDVFVETVNDKPALYRVVGLHGRIDKPE